MASTNKPLGMDDDVWPPDAEDLRRMRVEDELTLYEIADIYDRSHTAVRYWLKKYGIGDYGEADSDFGIDDQLWPMTDVSADVFDYDGSHVRDAIQFLEQVESELSDGELYSVKLQLDVKKLEKVDSDKIDD